MQDKLTEWFRENQRPLPWREYYQPYEVWISEIMLQQTQVKTVLPYFERWMQSFPNIASLAAAPEDKVLKHWEGLGYYSRARNLHKAAKHLVAENEGELYQEHAQLLKLPGIGRYTAGAICSIAYEQDQPLVDGNVIRVLARLDADEGNTRENMERFWMRATALLPAGQARDFNQGLMELGALICTPKSPKCGACPLKADCKAHAAGIAEALPNRGPAKKTESIQVAVGIIQKEGQFFIQKRPTKGLMGGLWEFPGGKVEKGETPELALKREIAEEMGIHIKNERPFMRIKHAYTRFKVDLHCFLVDYDRGTPKLTAATEGRWVPASELKEFPFPAANVKLVNALIEDEVQSLHS